MMNNKRARMIIAAALTVTVAGVAILSNTIQASAARRTFSGLEDILKENSANNTFRILEVVPEKSMGNIGYYVSGNEPAHYVLNGLAGASDRYHYIENEQTRLTEYGIMGEEGNTEKPLQKAAYEELYEGAVSPEEFAFALSGGQWNELHRRDTLSNNAVTKLSSNRIPESTVSINTVSVNTVLNYGMVSANELQSVSGDFIPFYEPVSVMEDGTSAMEQDPARNYFYGTQGNALTVSENHGIFDPHLVSYSGENSYRYRAVMKKVAGAYGYLPDEERSKTVTLGADWDGDLTDYIGCALYRFEDDAYVVKGFLDVQTVGGRSKVSMNAIDGSSPPLSVTTPMNGAESISVSGGNLRIEFPDEPVSEGGNKMTGVMKKEGETIEVKTSKVTAESIEESEVSALDGEELSGGEGDDDYELLFFTYDSGTVTDAVHYQVQSLEFAGNKSPNSTYVIDDSHPLVPNGAGTGLFQPNMDIIDPMTVVYHYTPGQGIYKMVPSEGTETAVCGSRILYRGGFVNNEWFLKHVFEQELDKGDYAYVDVTTITAAELQTYDLSQADFLYLSDGKGELLPCNGNYEYESYGSARTENEPVNDITYIKVMDILQRVSEERYPVMVDSSLYTAAEASSHISILAKLLAQKKTITFYNENKEKSEEELARVVLPTDYFEDKDHHFVNDSVYMFSRDAFATERSIVNPKFDEVFSDAMTEDGFEEVLKEIKTENSFTKEANKELEEEEKKELIPEKVSEAVSIQYILSSLSRRGVLGKDELHVLELQPYWYSDINTGKADYDCSVTTSTKDNRTLYTLTISGKKVIEDSTEKIVLTKMATTEFIGKTEDLNSNYDLIYIGLCTGKSNTPHMNVYDRGQYKGRTKYNDSKMNGLVYTNVGDKVTFDTKEIGQFGKGSVARYSGNDITEEKMNDLKEFVDAGYPLIFSQNFYHEVNGKLKVYDKQKNSSTPSGYIDNSSFMYKFADYSTKYLSKNVMQFVDNEGVDNERLEFYIYKARPSIDLDDKASGIITNEYGEKYLKYSFIVNNKGSIQKSGDFKASLFVDANADGRFSRKTEVVGNCTVTDRSGNAADINALHPGVRYILTRPLSGEFSGVITWKLELSQGEEGRRSSETGYWSVDFSEKIKINALQIATSSRMSSTWRASTWDMETQLNNPDSLLHKYAVVDPHVANYDISIKTITTDVFTQMITNGTLDPELTDYDMLIIGFADCYEEPSTEQAIQVIKDYIDSGRSVLFTHDTTSPVTSEATGPSTRWGERFTSLLRDSVGLDRYGVMSNAAGTHEKAYEPNTNRNSTVNEIQGFTNSTLEGYPGSGNTYRNLSYDYSNNTFRDHERGGHSRVRKTNSGQITDFPYKIADQIDVVKTHSQYFQLNLAGDADDDGEEDIVVWYTIDGNTNNTKVYPCYPNDVRNHYYIYNRGNVTYSGAGHQNMENGNDDEIKLFVNTMIASYYAGIKAPKVSIIENQSITSNPIENIYAPFDAALSDTEDDPNNYLDATTDLFFYANDLNLIKESSVLSAKVYYEDTNSTVTISAGGEDIAVSELDLNQYPVYDVLTNAIMQTPGDTAGSRMIEEGKVYRVPVPVSLLSGRNSRKIYIVVEDKVILSRGSDEKTVSNYDSTALSKLQLFNLD